MTDGSAAVVIVFAAIVLLSFLVACSMRQMHKVTHEEMTFSSSDIFLILMSSRVLSLFRTFWSQVTEYVT